MATKPEPSAGGGVEALASALKKKTNAPGWMNKMFELMKKSVVPSASEIMGALPADEKEEVPAAGLGAAEKTQQAPLSELHASDSELECASAEGRRKVSVRPPGGSKVKIPIQCSICWAHYPRHEMLPVTPQMYSWQGYINVICFDCAQCKTNNSPWLWQIGKPDVNQAEMSASPDVVPEENSTVHSPLKRQRVSHDGNAASNMSTEDYVPIQAFSNEDDTQPKKIYINHVFDKVDGCWKRTPMFSGSDSAAQSAFKKAQKHAWQQYLAHQRETYEIHVEQMTFRKLLQALKTAYPGESQARLRRYLNDFTVRFAQDFCRAISSSDAQDL